MSSFKLSGKLAYHSLPSPNLATCTRQDLKDFFENTYDLDETLFYGVKDESAYYKCPDRLRLPLVFYVAHTSAVFVNKMILAGLIKERVNPTFEALFETGVDEMSWDDTENYRMGGAFKWPPMSEVFEYRRKVREIILNVIDTYPLTLPIKKDDPLWALVMGNDHERIHLETSSVLLRQLPVHMLSRPEGWKYAPHSVGSPGDNSFVSHPGGVVTFGKPIDFPTYGWDNEYGSQTTTVPPFEVTKYTITNREFLAFVQAGGYENQSLWSEEGWRWVGFREARHPTFWVCDAGCKSGCGTTLQPYTHCTPVVATDAKRPKTETTYRYRAIYDVIEMPLDWPVDVNYHEAKAYCAWKGPEFRLMTEAEHNILRDPSPVSDALAYERDYVFAPDFQANLHLKFGSSTPVNMFPPNKQGIYDLHGNVWQWVEDHFNGLPGFQTSYLYDDFSSPCFDSRHSMILGGSFISTGDEASVFARFSFRRHFFQHAGFRIVRSTNVTPVRLVDLTLDLKFDLTQIPNLDSASALVPTTNCQYTLEQSCFLRNNLIENYDVPEAGTLHHVQSDYIRALHEDIKKYTPDVSRALVVGCGTGALPFELSKTFVAIVASDFCGQFVSTCEKFQKGTKVTVPNSSSVATLPKGVDPARIVFKQLTWLPQEIASFPAVVFHEHLDRALNATSWTVRFREVVSAGGIAVVTSRKEWDATKLESHLGSSFKLLEAKTLQTLHSDDSGVAPVPVHVTVWRKI